MLWCGDAAVVARPAKPAMLSASATSTSVGLTLFGALPMVLMASPMPFRSVWPVAPYSSAPPNSINAAAKLPSKKYFRAASDARALVRRRPIKQ